MTSCDPLADADPIAVVAREVGVPIADLRDLVAWIGDPPALAGLCRIAGAVLLTMPSLRDVVPYWPSPVRFLDLSPMEHATRKVVAAADTLKALWPPTGEGIDWTLEGSRRTGMAQTHSQAATLMQRPARHPSPYWLLCAHLLAATRRLDAHQDADGHTASARYSGWMAVRQMAHTREAPLLKRLPQTALDPRAYRDAVRAERERLDPEKGQPRERLAWRRLGAIETLLSYGLGDAAPERGPQEPAPRAPFQRTPPVYADILLDEEVDSVDGSPWLMRSGAVSALTPSEDELLALAGGRPGEVSYGKDALQIAAPGADPIEGRPDAAHLVRVRGAAAALARRAQSLGLRWGVLNGQDVTRLLETLKAHASSPATDTPSPLTVAAVLSAAFWTGRSLSTILASPGEIRVIGTRNSLLWDLPAGYPDTHAAFADGRSAGLVPTQAHRLRLPMAPLCAGILRRHLNIGEGKVDAALLSPLSEADRDGLLRAVRATLSEINATRGTRLTVSRVEGHLANTLLCLPEGDTAVAALLTGEDRHFAGAQLHYGARSVGELQKRYWAAVGAIYRSAGRSVPSLSSSGTAPNCTTETGAVIGSRIVPTVEAVRQLCRTLWCRTQRLMPRRPGLPDIACKHQDMLLYTWALLSFATGFRAVRDPLFRPFEVDPASGFAVLSDKDSADGYNTRIIGLPPTALTQLRHYWGHLDALATRLAMGGDARLFEIQRVVRGSSRTPTDLCFLLTPEGAVTPVGPQDLEALLADTCAWRLPANANRHYLRGRLLDRGCPQAVIDALLGHWERGQEPAGPYSGLDPIAMRDQHVDHLEALMREDGWIPVAGLNG